MHHHRILLIAFPAQGHINPALQFAKRLIRLGAHVTLATTIYMHRRISNNSTTIPGLSFLPFSDGYDDGFTGGSDYSLYVSEFKRRGTEFVTSLILSSSQEGRPFTCLVYTLNLPWAAEVARGLHLPAAMLWVQPSTLLGIHYHYFHGYRDYIMDKFTREPLACSVDLPGLPSMAAADMPPFLLDSTSPLNGWILSISEEQFRVLDTEAKPRVLVNTFEALEAEALRAVDDKFHVIPIGPLIPSAFLDGKDPTDTSFGGDLLQASSGCVEWLDSKEEASVVYVSFGSFWELATKQLVELARALLDCGRPFLWVIRDNRKKQQITEEERERLLQEEEEFMRWREKLELKGKIVKWCSQVEVLSHASLGCFVTHCGWNSTMESLVSGVPTVAFPQWADQKTNAKLIEDVWKTGVRVDHEVNEELGVVEAEEIRRCLDLVMGSGEKGDELRRNVKKWKSLAKEAAREGGSSDENLRTFLHDVGEEYMRTTAKNLIETV